VEIVTSNAEGCRMAMWCLW